jgi:DNA processing protein
VELTDQQRQFLAAIRLSRLPGVGAAKFAELVNRFGSPLAALAEELRQGELFVSPDKAPLGSAEAHVEEYFRDGGEGVFFGAEDYPRLLRRIPEPPPYLFRRGPLWPLDPFAAAIVGTRDATNAGRAFAFELARSLSALGVTVISGGATGIDTSAHRGALAHGGPTVLVTATGIDRHYPPASEPLYREIERKGCLLTELLPGTPPRRDFFPTRNRIIAGLSRALVVIEGRQRSGTASSVVHMRKLKRPIFVWTGADRNRFDLPDDVLSRGGLALDGPDADAVVRVMLAQA